MTNKEIIKETNLDIECNKAFTKSLGVECKVIKSPINEIEFYFNRDSVVSISSDDFKTPGFIIWYGLYDTLSERIGNIRKAIFENKEILNMWLSAHDFNKMI